jgi:ABC-type transporter Mla MlaB component
MLRILVFDEPFTLKLRVEGELSRNTLPRYEEAITWATAHRANRKLLVDVGDLTLLDSAAEHAILTETHSGVYFVGAVSRFAELLRREEQRECEQSCSLLRRIGFALTEHCRASVRPICMKLYRLVRSEV